MRAKESFSKLAVTDYLYRPLLENLDTFKLLKCTENSFGTFMGVIPVNCVKTNIKRWSQFNINGSSNIIFGIIYAVSLKIAVLVHIASLAVNVSHCTKNIYSNWKHEFRKTEPTISPCISVTGILEEWKEIYDRKKVPLKKYA